MLPLAVAVPECVEVSCAFRRGLVSSSHDVVPNCGVAQMLGGATPTVCVLEAAASVNCCTLLAHDAPAFKEMQTFSTSVPVLTDPVNDRPS